MAAGEEGFEAIVNVDVGFLTHEFADMDIARGDEPGFRTYIPDRLEELNDFGVAYALNEAGHRGGG